jgi:hypothetical protein
MCEQVHRVPNPKGALSWPSSCQSTNGLPFDVPCSARGAASGDPKMRSSKFLQFVSKMSRGEIILEDNQVGGLAGGWVGGWGMHACMHDFGPVVVFGNCGSSDVGGCRCSRLPCFTPMSPFTVA